MYTLNDPTMCMRHLLSVLMRSVMGARAHRVHHGLGLINLRRQSHRILTCMALCVLLVACNVGYGSWDGCKRITK